jgi:hypothetical protein
MENDSYYKRLADKNKPEDPSIASLENNSYDDIDWLNKFNAPTNKKIKYWKERYDNASSWLGKWYCQLQINKFKKQLFHYVDKN